MQTINTNSENSNATSLVASAPAEFVTPNHNLNQSSTSVASPGAAMATDGVVTLERVQALTGIIAQASALVASFPVVPPSQRRRIRSLTVGDADFTARIKELSALNAEAVPAGSSSEALAAQDAVHSALLEARAALQFLTGLVEGASVTTTAQFLGSVGAAYNALKFHRRIANPALKEQLARAARRFRRTAPPAKPASTSEGQPKPASAAEPTPLKPA